MTVDATDRTILKLLADDGRATLARLAQETGLSTSAVQARVQRLERSGTITHYRAELDLGQLGLTTTAIVQLSPLDPAHPDEVPQQLEGMPEVESCYSVAGDTSYTIIVRVAQPGDLEALLQRIRTRANVATRTTVVLRTHFEHRAPALREPEDDEPS